MSKSDIQAHQMKFANDANCFIDCHGAFGGALVQAPSLSMAASLGSIPGALPCR
jgi:hypothetical protein